MDTAYERRAWTLVYLCLGIIEGGTAAVMVRSLFGAAVPPLLVDLVLAVVSAAPAWANLASLAYARRAQGRPKVEFLRPLLVAMALCVAALALLPRGGAGLVLFLVLYGAARLLWAGVDTVRSVIWSVNFPRHLRARVTGRIMVNGAVAIALVGLLIGWLLEHRDPWYRAAILAAATCGLAGSVAFKRFRVRQEQRLLADERARVEEGARFDLAGVRELLRRDARYRRYMFAMSVFGAGNLMLTPLMVVCLDDVLGASELVQVAVTSAVPIIMMPLVLQPWAAFLDRRHVIVFRSVHAWVPVGGAALFVLAVLLHATWLVWPGALLMGVSYAAGSLGWSLGHNDFAPRGEETRYMALHVTLTGMRGLLAPPAAILAYHGLRRLAPGFETVSMLLPFALIVTGACLFTAMRRDFVAGGERDATH
jgi:MFS family permease